MRNLIVDRAGHLVLQLNPRNCHREVNVVVDIPARFRERQKEPASFNRDSFDQFSRWFLDMRTKSLKVASEKS